MSDHRFYDGIFADANRSNEAAGRSWHVPAEESAGAVGRAVIFLAGLVTLIVGLAFVCAAGSVVA